MEIDVEFHQTSDGSLLEPFTRTVWAEAGDTSSSYFHQKLSELVRFRGGLGSFNRVDTVRRREFLGDTEAANAEVVVLRVAEVSELQPADNIRIHETAVIRAPRLTIRRRESPHTAQVEEMRERLLLLFDNRRGSRLRNLGQRFLGDRLHMLDGLLQLRGDFLIANIDLLPESGSRS